MDAKKIKAKCNSNYTKNLKIIKKRYPELAEKLGKLKDSGKYKLVPNTDNKTFNLYMNEYNKFYYPQNSPLYDVKEKIESFSLKNPKMVLLLGLGLGYELMYYTMNLAEEYRTETIFVVEKDLEIFAYSLYSLDLTQALNNKNIEFLVGIKKKELFVKLKKLIGIKHVMFSKCLNSIYYQTSMELNREYYFEAVKSFKDALVHVLTNVGNSPEDSLWGLQNMLSNLEQIVFKPGINMLYNKFKNKPAVIVASGPSLKKNLHLLKGLEDKALIVSAQSTLTVLLKNGIKPHMVTALERTEATTKSLEGYSEDEVKDVFLTACPVIPTSSYEVYPGPSIVVYRAFDHFKWLQIDKGLLNVKHSSANMAFKVAAAMGANPIILIGQDLAYARDGKTTHIGEVKDGARQDFYNQYKKLEVMGNDGKPILTNSTWYTFLKSYEVDIEEYEGTCINATEGGALIQGTKVMTFQEAIDKYINEEVNPLQLIKETLNNFTPANANKDFEKISRIIKESKKDLNKIIDYCKEGVKSWEDYKDELKEYVAKDTLEEKEILRIREISNKIMKPKGEMQKFSSTFQLLLMHIVQPMYINFEIEMNAIYNEFEIYEQAVAKILLYQQKWYAHVNNATLIIHDELIKAEEKLLNRGE